jgi:hypothetical protein
MNRKGKKWNNVEKKAIINFSENIIVPNLNNDPKKNDKLLSDKFLKEIQGVAYSLNRGLGGVQIKISCYLYKKGHNIRPWGKFKF